MVSLATNDDDNIDEDQFKSLGITFVLFCGVLISPRVLLSGKKIEHI